MENKLTPLEYKNQRIMTTKILAEQYGTEETNIQTNFTRNQSRFIEGKHYYKLEGQALKEFKKSLSTESMEPFKYAPQLILWTERGAARHAKILETDEAWEVYEELEDTYFKVKEIIQNDPMKLFDARLELLDKLTSQARLQFKPSHKTKLKYDKVIRSVTNTKEEYEAVKAWVFCTLGVSKWEDTCTDDCSRIMEIISAASSLISIKRIEQLRFF